MVFLMNKLKGNIVSKWTVLFNINFKNILSLKIINLFEYEYDQKSDRKGWKRVMGEPSQWGTITLFLTFLSEWREVKYENKFITLGGMGCLWWIENKSLAILIIEILQLCYNCVTIILHFKKIYFFCCFLKKNVVQYKV